MREREERLNARINVELPFDLSAAREEICLNIAKILAGRVAFCVGYTRDNRDTVARLLGEPVETGVVRSLDGVPDGGVVTQVLLDGQKMVDLPGGHTFYHTCDPSKAQGWIAGMGFTTTPPSSP